MDDDGGSAATGIVCVDTLPSGSVTVTLYAMFSSPVDPAAPAVRPAAAVTPSTAVSAAAASSNPLRLNLQHNKSDGVRLLRRFSSASSECF